MHKMICLVCIDGRDNRCERRRKRCVTKRCDRELMTEREQGLWWGGYALMAEYDDIKYF